MTSTPKDAKAALPKPWDDDATPERGGKHDRYGIYIGGSGLDHAYTLSNQTRSYRYSSQCRNTKSISKIERGFNEDRDSTSILKFNGKLMRSSGEETELHKEKFIETIEDLVREHGEQTFYYLTSKDGPSKMVNLTEHHHEYTVEDVINEYESRLLDTHIGTYDQYELDEIEISRKLIISRIHSDLWTKIKNRYDHDPNFLDYPGSVLFMMALEVCNASAQIDIKSAEESFKALTLDSYKGENVTDLVIETLKLLNILKGAYALPINLGSKIIRKVSNTSSEFFNRSMYNLLDKVKKFERPYQLLDPRKITDDKGYSTYGPRAICAEIQKVHSELLTDGDWPALTSKIPEANFSTVQDQSSDSKPKSSQNQSSKPRHQLKDEDNRVPGHCWVKGCNNIWPCPEHETNVQRKRRERKEKKKLESSSNSIDSSKQSQNSTRQPLAPWRYLSPSDPTY